MSFDPTQFTERVYTEANDTKIIPVPAGEYIALIDEAKVGQWQKKDDPSKCGLKLDIVWSLDDAGVKEALGREKVTVRQTIMLDLTDSGDLDFSKGRNVGLGKLREAVNLNQPGVPFAFSQFAGRMAKVSTSQRIDGENIYTDVKAVTKLA